MNTKREASPSVTVHVYQKKGEIALFRSIPQKYTPDLWFKYLAETPRDFAELEAKVLKRPVSHEPCWWGQGERTPEQDGYNRIDSWEVLK